jgi:hypothetical protein
MEAAQTLRFPTSSVQLTPDGVLIDGLLVGDAKLAELVQARIDQGDSPEQAVLDALEIGARVLDRESTAAEVDFVKREFEKVSGDFRRAFEEQAESAGKELTERIDQFLAPEDGALSQLLASHSDGLAEELTRHFGADRSTAVQNQIRDAIDKKLAEQRDALLKQFSAEDGHNPLNGFKAAVSKELKAHADVSRSLLEKLAALEVEMQRLHDAREAQDELGALHDLTAIKGRDFEDAAFAVIERLADGRGDAAHNVGDERSESGGKKGDIVIEIDAQQGSPRGRIVLELKDERLSRNQAWAVLNEAMVDRDACFAILLVASGEEVPARTEPLHEYEGNKMIVSLDKETLDLTALDLAYRYARSRALMTGESELAVDAAGVQQAAEEALNALKETQKIRNSLTGAAKGVTGAREALDAMVERVKLAVERVESLVAAADDSTDH